MLLAAVHPVAAIITVRKRGRGRQTIITLHRNSFPFASTIYIAKNPEEIGSGDGDVEMWRNQEIYLHSVFLSFLSALCFLYLILSLVVIGLSRE